MTDPRDEARRLEAERETRLQNAIAKARRQKTGVTPGGPYSHITVNAQGLVTWADAGGIGALIGGSTTSAANDTTTTVTWDNSNSWGHNNNGVWSSGTPTKLFAPFDGYYTLYVHTTWASNATGYRRTSLRRYNVAGSVQGTITTVTLPPVSGVSTEYDLIVPQFELAAGESIDAQVRQTSGGSLALQVSSFIGLALL